MSTFIRTRRHTMLVAIVVIVASLVAAGCGSDSGKSKSSSGHKGGEASGTSKDAMKDSKKDASDDGEMMDSKKGASDEGEMMDSKKGGSGDGEMMAMGEPDADARMLTSRAVELVKHSSKYGDILFDQDGLGMYLFKADTDSTSTCYGECADAWPPVLVKGDPTAGSGAKQELLGTTTRKDGAVQLTYNGHPMYYFKGDRDYKIECQNVDEHGGLWLVVDADGNEVTKPHIA